MRSRSGILLRNEVLGRADLLKKCTPRWLVHALLGVLYAFALLYCPKLYVAAVGVTLAICFTVVELARFRVSTLQRWLSLRLASFLRPEEDRQFMGATYYLVGAAITAIVFPPGIAALAILFLALGDPIAAAVGLWKGRTRLWRRTVEGNLSCAAACAIIAALVSLQTASPALLTAELGAVIATFFQALPWRIDDNLTIPIGSAAAMLLTETILQS